MNAPESAPTSAQLQADAQDNRPVHFSADAARALAARLAKLEAIEARWADFLTSPQLTVNERHLVGSLSRLMAKEVS